MVRYTIFLAIVLGTAATALAAISPSATRDLASGQNVTVIEKNQAFPLVGPLVIEPCQTEDCSEV